VLWNLLQLANALFPLIEEAALLQDILKEYQEDVEVAYLEMMKSKLGLFENDVEDKYFITELEKVLQLSETDMTLFFRLLANVKKSNAANELKKVQDAFYLPDEITGSIENQWKSWFSRYGNRLKKETKNDSERGKLMNIVNPKYVLRNYMAQLAIDAAGEGDYGLLAELFDLLRKPYSEQPEHEKWFAKRPDWARNKVGCSMLSCSS
jgi:uncharacterized protein YdiU (UPF0061 family)